MPSTGEFGRPFQGRKHHKQDSQAFSLGYKGEPYRLGNQNPSENRNFKKSAGEGLGPESHARASANR